MADNPFEIPQSMRDTSEQSLKQAHAAYAQLMDFVTKTMDAWMGAMPAHPMTAGLKNVQDRAMEIAKENAESAFAFARRISSAKTPQDVLTLQTQFAQERLQTFVAQTQRLYSLIQEAPPKPERGASDAGVGPMPADRAMEIAKNNAESATALVEGIGKAENSPAPSDDALPADTGKSPSGSSGEKVPRRKSAKSKTATSGTSTTPPPPSPAPLTPQRRPRSKPKAAKKEPAPGGSASRKDG